MSHPVMFDGMNSGIVSISPYESMGSTFQPAVGSDMGVWLWSPFGEGGMISKNSSGPGPVLAAFCWDLRNLQSFENLKGDEGSIYCICGMKVFDRFEYVFFCSQGLFFSPQFLKHFQCPSVCLSKVNTRFLNMGMARFCFGSLGPSGKGTWRHARFGPFFQA